MNTPLANAMKKVGMTPLMGGSHLNDYVKKKVVVTSGSGCFRGSNSNKGSSSGSPKPMSIYDGVNEGSNGASIDNITNPG